MSAAPPVDIVIAGGGLAGGLIALALAQRRPELTIRLIESGDTLGGNHIWSSFEADIAPGEHDLVDPLIAYSWPAYDVRFPAVRRTLAAPYRSIDSARFDSVLRARLGASVMTGTPVAALDRDGATLIDGRRIDARGVIDARGGADLSALDCGWQKFVGHELQLGQPHGLDRPIVMDATVAQLDGYRFVYVLPFAEDRLFVEDTYYSDGPELDPAALGERIATYAHRQNWQVRSICRRETGVLPVVLDGDPERLWVATSPGLAKAGMRAGLFHPTTGYSLPDAVRTAALVTGLADPTSEALHALLRDHAARRWREAGFYRLLDRLLFRAALPAARYKVLERFYRLSPELIARFYAGQSTLADKARILAGKPPVPLGRAIAALRGRRPSA